jgi:DNA-binding CsgD family transcriptional regulator
LKRADFSKYKAEAISVHPPDGEGKRKPSKSYSFATPVMWALVPPLAIQVAGASFFTFRTLADLFAWSSVRIPWEYFEIMEVLASLGMVFGVLATVMLLIPNLRRINGVEERLEAASGQFQTHVEGLFSTWNLSESEREVGLLVVKGFSNAEIASYRNTSESTTKSQVSSIFRKSGLSNRQQLVSFVVEDMLDGVRV